MNRSGNQNSTGRRTTTPGGPQPRTAAYFDRRATGAGTRENCFELIVIVVLDVGQVCFVGESNDSAGTTGADGRGTALKGVAYL